ncbi:MAG: prepilin peptidase [Gemmatimonadota bacterium]
MAPDATPLLVGGLAVACCTDLRDRRIPNALVVALGTMGVGGAALGWAPGLSGLDAVFGLGIGFLVWLPFHLAGMLGAGASGSTIVVGSAGTGRESAGSLAPRSSSPCGGAAPR